MSRSKDFTLQTMFARGTKEAQYNDIAVNKDV